MEWLRTAQSIAVANEHEQKYLVHETKHALLGGTLFAVLSLPWTSSLIQNVFPVARGPMVHLYKVILFIALYYIIQKTDWFQQL